MDRSGRLAKRVFRERSTTRSPQRSLRSIDAQTLAALNDPNLGLDLYDLDDNYDEYGYMRHTKPPLHRRK